ncbi:MAG: zinc-binding dehydrogenase, partial [Elusimicrobiaceae bacterium]|nr:zinc-binding dehydrogenase [Elusimicrobiaceae bacterium]
KILGCKKAVVFGRDKNHLKLSEELGADAIISTCDTDFKQQALTYTSGNGFDYIFETAGSIDTIKYCLELATPKAHICFVGTPNRELTFSIREWEYLNRKELNLVGSWMSYSSPFPGKEWEQTQQCFNSGKLKFHEKMFFKKFALRDAQSAFRMFSDKTNNVKGRVLLII